MTTQSVASVIRQVLAVLVTVYGVLTASVTALHLPVAVSAVLTAFGPLILLLEHYVADPSTGTLTTQTPAGPAPVAPVTLPAPVPSVPGNVGAPTTVPVVPAAPPPPA